MFFVLLGGMNNSSPLFKIIPINPEHKILDGQLCSECKNLLIIPFQCNQKEENFCSKKICQKCLNGKTVCVECEDGKYEKNEILEKKINERYKVCCNNCSLQMIPNQFNHHQETSCKIEFTKEAEESRSKKNSNQIESKLAFGESESEINCVGEVFGKRCGKKEGKIKILYHQLECDLVDNLKSIEYPLYSRLVYLLIGVGKYRDKFMSNLKAPPNDVEEMKTCLEKIGFEKNEKNILLNEKACKSDLQSHLNQLKEEMDGKNEEDKLINSHSMLIFYFSGHGMHIKRQQKDVHQICPHDYQVRSDENGLNVQDLVEFLFGLNCKHVLLVLDSCHVGGIFR